LLVFSCFCTIISSFSHLGKRKLFSRVNYKLFVVNYLAIRNYRHFLYHNLLDGSTWWRCISAISQFSVNANHPLQQDLHPVNKSSLILSLLISEVSICNLAFKSCALLHIKTVLLLICFFGFW
jgi:hypothetical protein